MREVILKSFDSFMEAELIKNLLAKYNIKSFIQRKGLAPGVLGNAEGAGVCLFVAEKDIDKAKQILEQN